MITLFIIFFATLLFGQVGVFSPVAGVSLYLHDVMLVIVLAAGGWEVYKKKPVVMPALYWPVISFSVIGVISLLFALTRFEPWQVGQGALYLARWVAYALLYAYVVQVPSLHTFLLRGLYWTGSMFSLLGLAQYVLYPNLRNLWYLGWDPHYFRLFSTFLDPNFAGLFILLTILLGWVIPIEKKWWWMTQGINILALYLTYSRGSYLAFILAALVWIVIEKRWKLLGTLLLGVGLIIFLPRPGGETLRLLRIDSTVSRVNNWQETVQLIQRSPIGGHGFNMLRFIERNSIVQPVGYPVSKAAAGVDNSFLFLLATTGVVGLWFYLRVLWESRGITAASRIAILVAIVVHSQFINSLFYPWIMLWLWIYWGAAEGQRKAKRK